MKKNFLLLMLLAVVAMFSMNASAQSSLVNQTIFKAPFKYTIETVNATAKTGTVKVSKNDADAETSLTIPEDFTETVEGTEFTGQMKFTVDKIDVNGFADLSNLTSVSIPKSVKEIGANAFSGDYALATLTIAENSELITIGNEAFNAWTASTFDLSKAGKLKILPANLLTTAAARAGAGNTYITKVVLPTSITTPSTALAHLPNLSDLNIANTKTATVVASFLAGNTKIEDLTLPATVESIVANALLNSAVKNLTINSYQTNNTQTIGIFGTDLESLTVKNEFKGTFAGAGNVASVTFAGKFSGTIDAGAFTEVENVTFNEFNGTIAAGGIALKNADDVFPTVTFGELKSTITANAITGVTYNAEKRYVTLKVGKISVDLSAAGAIVNGGVKTATVTAEVANKLNLNVLGDAKTITIEGAITAAAAAVTISTANANLTTLDLGSIAIKEDAFAVGSLVNANALTLVKWAPGTPTKAFNKAAFAAATVSPANPTVVMQTTTDVAYTQYGWDGTENDDTKLYNVKFTATAPTPAAVTTSIEFKGKQCADGYYYATVFIPQSKKAWIAKTKDIVIYSVYLDGSEIYHNPLRVFENKYYINGASAINAGLIVKSKSNEEITITYDDGITKQSIQNAAYALTDKFDGLLYNNGVALPGAKIIMEDPYFTLVDNTNIKYSAAIAAPNNKVIVRVSNPEVTDNVRYADFDPTKSPTKAIEANGFFLLADPVETPAAARQVIWLDEDGNTTAIESVEVATPEEGKMNNATNNAIYNLQGVRVNGAQKGIYIQNGKKYVVK